MQYKMFRTHTQLMSLTKQIIENSSSTSEVIPQLQALIDSTAFVSLTARELLALCL